MRWNTENDEELRRLVAEGLTNRELTDHFGMNNCESIYRRMQKLGITRSEELKKELQFKGGIHGGNKTKELYDKGVHKCEFHETESGCLIPKYRSPNKEGYFSATVNGKTTYLHRKLWIEKYGPISSEECIRHTCDNSQCCNTDHMILGTNYDNVQDRVRRSRCARGSNNGRANITEEDAARIKYEMSCFKNRTHPRPFKLLKDLMRYLADKYGSTPSALYMIYRNDNWKHVKETPFDI